MVGDVEQAISECLRIVHMDNYPISYQHIITQMFLILDKNSFSLVIYHGIYNALQKKFKFIPLIRIYDWLIVTCRNKIIEIHKNSVLFHYVAGVQKFHFILLL